MKIIASPKLKSNYHYIIKFTNIKYWRGGGKCPHRIRRGQNYSIYVKVEMYNWSDNGLINYLYYKTEGRIVATSSTKVVRKIRRY